MFSLQAPSRQSLHGQSSSVAPASKVPWLREVGHDWKLSLKYFQCSVLMVLHKNFVLNVQKFNHRCRYGLGCLQRLPRLYLTAAPSVLHSVFTITEKDPTRAFSWLKAPTSAFTFKTLLRHYAKQALTPRSLNVKLGLRRKGHKGRAVTRRRPQQGPSP